MLTPWKDSYDQSRQHIKKQRHYFASKGPSSQSYVFPIVMYGCENWTIEKAECQRIDAFELWCWRRLLRLGLLETSWTSSPLDCKEIQPVRPKGNQFWIFIGRTDAEADAEAQYFGHLMQRADPLEKTLMLQKLKAGGEGDNRGWNGWMASLTQWTWVWANSRICWRTGKSGVPELKGSQRVRHNLVTEQHEWNIKTEDEKSKNWAQGCTLEWF